MITVFVTSNSFQFCLHFLRIAHDHRRPGIRMKFRRLKSLFDKLPHEPENLLLTLLSGAVKPEKAIALDDAHIGGKILLLYICEKHLARRAQQMRLNRNRRVEHESESGTGRICTFMLDRSLDCLRAPRDFGVVDFRTRNREHQSRCVAEVLDEVDWAGATRQIANTVEPQLDIVKLFASLGR